jgi:hypothetical protein
MKNKVNEAVKFRKHLLFQIPNPFDEYRPLKDNWNMRVETVESKIIETRKTIDEMLKELKCTFDLPFIKPATVNKTSSPDQ